MTPNNLFKFRLPALPRIARDLARWLELRAIAMTPELLNPMDGLRATVIVASLLFLVILTGERTFSWAIFAGFWACLADTGGPPDRRRRHLLTFTFAGTITAFLSAWLTGLPWIPPLAVAPFMVGTTALLTLWQPEMGLVATLLGVVAVVAAGAAHPAMEAVKMALAFLVGSSWATIILLAIWPGAQWLPARQAVAGVFSRLSDMAHDIATDISAPSLEIARLGRHRRAVRLAIERANSQLILFNHSDNTICHHLRSALGQADAVFHALLALDHLPPLTPESRKTTLEAAAILTACADHLRKSDRHRKSPASPALHLPADGSPPAEHAAVSALTRTLVTMGSEVNFFDLPQKNRVTPQSRQASVRAAALRSALAVAIVTLTAHLLSLNYPYWATMAVVVVLNPVRHVSISRGIERIIGSVCGGMLALAILSLSTSPVVIGLMIIIGTLATLALRPVNYTLFVVFLTLLFVLIMNLLQPTDGIAAARILDNVIGSVMAIVVTLVLSPGRARPISDLIAEAVEANRHYLAAIADGDAATVAVARRRAGLASNEAEIAAHGPDRLFGPRLTTEDREGLAAARRLAGEAAMLWHLRNAAASKDGEGA
ncbi:FUSC family protein [Rhizobium paknamense]